MKNPMVTGGHTPALVPMRIKHACYLKKKHRHVIIERYRPTGRISEFCSRLLPHFTFIHIRGCSITLADVFNLISNCSETNPPLFNQH